MKINGNIQIPGDKSIAHRALIIASFCEGISILDNMPQSLDVKSTINCLRQCGIKIEIEKDGLVIIKGRGSAMNASRSPPPGESHHGRQKIWPEPADNIHNSKRTKAVVETAKGAESPRPLCCCCRRPGSATPLKRT